MLIAADWRSPKLLKPVKKCSLIAAYRSLVLQLKGARDAFAGLRSLGLRQSTFTLTAVERYTEFLMQVYQTLLFQTPTQKEK